MTLSTRFCILLGTVGLTTAQAIVLPPVWRWSNPTPHGANIVDLAVQDGAYLQVGERGQVFTSDDFQLWLPRDSQTTAALRSVAFFKDQIVITGEAGTVLHGSSPGGLRLLDLGTADWLEGVASSPDRLVAVGDNGAIYTSTNAATWQRQPVAFTNVWLRGVAYGNHTFVAVGENGFIAVSSDGAAWQTRTSGTAVHLNRVAWAGDKFLSVGDAGITLTSAAGDTWQPVTTGASNPLYAAAGISISRLVTGDQELRLLENSAWSDQTNPALPAPAPSWTYYAAAYDSLGFVIAGQSGMTVESYTTNGTAHWQTTSDPIRSWLWQVTRAPDYYLAVGDHGTILSSLDGVVWDLELVPDTATNSVLLGVGGSTNLSLAVGSRGTILWATNVFLWNQLDPSPTTNDLQGVLYDGSQFLLCGGEGALLTSPDGLAWTTQSTGTRSFLMSLERHPAGYVAVGENGAMLTSSNAVDWVNLNPITTNWLSQVRWLDGQLLAVGENGTILRSANGSSWSPVASGTARWLNAVDWIDGLWFVAGNQGTLLISPDSTNWFDFGTITRKSLYGLTIHQGQLVTVGSEGAIVRSLLVPPDSPVAIAEYSRVSGQNLFLFTGQPGQRFQLEASSDLANWSQGPLLEFLDETGALLYLEANDPAASPAEYYRTVTLP